MRVVIAPELSAGLVIGRPDDPAKQVLVIIGGDLTRSDVRGLSRLLLNKRERVELACALRSSSKPATNH